MQSRGDDEGGADLGAEYQLNMMRCLREVNADNNTVGWCAAAPPTRGASVRTSYISHICLPPLPSPCDAAGIIPDILSSTPAPLLTCSKPHKASCGILRWMIGCMRCASSIMCGALHDFRAGFRLQTDVWYEAARLRLSPRSRTPLAGRGAT